MEGKDEEEKIEKKMEAVKERKRKNERGRR